VASAPFCTSHDAALLWLFGNAARFVSVRMICAIVRLNPHGEDGAIDSVPRRETNANIANEIGRQLCDNGSPPDMTGSPDSDVYQELLKRVSFASLVIDNVDP